MTVKLCPASVTVTAYGRIARNIPLTFSFSSLDRYFKTRTNSFELRNVWFEMRSIMQTARNLAGFTVTYMFLIVKSALGIPGMTFIASGQNQ